MTSYLCCDGTFNKAEVNAMLNNGKQGGLKGRWSLVRLRKIDGVFQGGGLLMVTGHWRKEKQLGKGISQKMRYLVVAQ